MADEQDINIDVGENTETEVEVTEAPKIESESHFSEPEPEPESNEQEQQVNSAQKRINQLTKKMRDAEKREQEALRYAQQVQNEASQLKDRMKQLDTGYLEQFGRSLNVEAQQAEAELKRALEVGDSDVIVEAQKKLYEVGVRGQQYRQAQAEQQRQEQYAAQQMQQMQQAGAAPQQQQVRRPDRKAEQWAEKNEWFGQDEAMTFAAFGIHKKLVEDEGFDPTADEYYTELDRRMSKEFPQKLGSSKRPAQTVAGVSRSTNNSGRNRKVRLTPTQVTIAKKLGVPLEEYAKYVKD